MNVILLRHAETAGNLLGQYIGSTNQSIDPAGRARARALASQGDVKKVYTSELKRTKETAELLYPAARIIPCAELNEMDFGRFEQKTWQELEHNSDYRAWLDTNCESSCPDGERKDLFTQRCVTAFLQILTIESAAGAREVHFVVHGGTIMALLSTLAKPEREYFEWRPDYCGGYALEYQASDDSTDDITRILLLRETIRPRQ